MPRSDLLLLALVAAGLVASCGAQGALQRWLATIAPNGRIPAPALTAAALAVLR